MSKHVSYKDLPEYAKLSQADKDALDALIGAAPFSVDDATMDRIIHSHWDMVPDDEPDWKALALQAGKALKTVSEALEGHGDAADACELCNAKVTVDIALTTMLAAGLEV